jgi:5'-nucleotidase
MAKKEKLILITNDDDINSPGIAALVEAVRGLGRVVVVAPDKPQSGMGHAITIGFPLRMRKVQIFEGIESYTTSGTPVDCVKLAVDKILHCKPDICLSGINHGANHSINVIYSGTMSAAMEASIEGIPSIGFSLIDYSYEADLTAAKHFVTEITKAVMSKKQPMHFLLNVNIPKGSLKQIKGIKLCRQAYAKYDEEFDVRVDPHNKNYYWLTGEFKNFDKGKDTDVWALKNNFVSVVPVQFDLTNHQLKKQLTKNKLFG